MTESEIINSIRDNKPFLGLVGVRVASVRELPPIVPAMENETRRADRWRVIARPDVMLELQFGENKVTVYGEVQNSCTPKLAQQIAPWLASLKQAKKNAAFALICPVLSPETQAVCDENNIDFIDLAGNISINVPGKFLLRRIGIKARIKIRPPGYRDPFSGASSRVVRVLLEKPKQWRLTDIGEELVLESKRNCLANQNFQASAGSISKVLRTLEEELLLRRGDSKIVVPEPRRLLSRWADKYKERFRWYLRRSFKIVNPFGEVPRLVAAALGEQVGYSSFAFTGAAAAQFTAPFVDLDRIDIFLADPAAGSKLRALTTTVGAGPDLRVFYPYDVGVFMYCRLVGGFPLVSPIQTYLDLFAQGGRDQKQADYLLERVIEPGWRNQ